jgi:Anti-sigma-K factor rskA
MTRLEMAHEPFGEWSALAAVGALDGAERTRFDAHLAAGCATCEANLRELSQVAAALPWALPDVALRPEVRVRLMERVTAQRQERAELGASARPAPTISKSAGERRPWAWAGGLVAASLATALVWGLHDTRQALESERVRADRLEQELAQERAITSLVAHTDTHSTALRGLGLAAHAEGWIVWSPSKREGFMVVHHLPMLRAGQQYQLWVVGESAWALAGTFQVDAIGHAALTVRVERERPERFAVTVEPTGPHSVPTGPTVMQGGSSS